MAKINNTQSKKSDSVVDAVIKKAMHGSDVCLDELLAYYANEYRKQKHERN